MTYKKTLLALSVLTACFCAPQISLAQNKLPQLVTDKEWSDYTGKFLKSDGSVVDNSNENISHSEGQGYGMTLAVYADKQADFDKIWGFANDKLRIRDDKLFNWKFDPNTKERTDESKVDAADGDIFIAYGLILAYEKWGDQKYLDAALPIIQDIHDLLIKDINGHTYLTPGTYGFSEEFRPDGPVINLSYWIFEAFPVFNKYVKSERWNDLLRGGMHYVYESRFGKTQMPVDTVSIAGELKPGYGFPPEFAFSTVRVPLYLVRYGVGNDPFLAEFIEKSTDADGNMIVYDVMTDELKYTLPNRGYRLIAQMPACVKDGRVIDKQEQEFEADYYYPASLHLFGLSYLRQAHPECLK